MRNASFITEKAAEGLLERETRRLPMPGGAERCVTDFKLLWQSYDIACEGLALSPAEISAMTALRADREGLRFEDSLVHVVRGLREEADRKLDDRIAYLEERLSRAQRRFRQCFASAARSR